MEGQNYQTIFPYVPVQIYSKTFPFLICTWFLKNQVRTWFLQATQAVKIKFKNRLKSKFIELDFSNSIFQKSSIDQQGDCWFQNSTGGFKVWLNTTTRKEQFSFCLWKFMERKFGSDTFDPIFLKNVRGHN